MTRAQWTGVKLGGCVLGMAALLGIVQRLGIPWSRLTPEQVRAAVLAWGWWSPLAFFLLYAQPLVPLPISVMGMAGGLLFGVWGGGALTLIAAVIRACGQFVLARTCGREAIQMLLKGRLATWDARLGRQGFQAVLWVRLVPNFPYDIQNLVLGCSSVSLGAFALGTLVGLIPSMFLWVYLGQTLTDLANLLRVIAVLLAITAVWLLQRRLRAARASPAAGATQPARTPS